jgi:ferrous iron transport protein A
MEMGVVPGVSVKMVKAAPFGDPIEIRLRGYSLAIRKSEADAIEVSE